jgi:quinol-cytochrome oxidoreductase complex cytochrome b subunit/mono/diheme cytochrome c family protein
VSLLNWLDHRTGYRAFVHEALFERIPGGARWRYVWGSTLVFAFVTQVVTGIFLWMAYSPSSQTAWESVYYIQHEMTGGWLLRGIHHFMAQAMVVLLAIHLMQVIIDGAYRAPREINFWLGLVLMMIVLGLSLTGYLLPWDQKGYWATQVATNLSGIVPVVGPALQKVAVGGPEYGHHTLTRFFALHAGVLPGLLIAFLVLHVALFRRHGICYKQPAKRPDTTFWPDQVWKDAVACLGVLAIVLLLTIHFKVQATISGDVSYSHLGAELDSPADSTTPYDARPEWYFLFLFQFLKLFEGQGERGEFLGAIVVPGLVFAALAFMPFIGRWKLGHRFNVLFILILMLGIAWLTGAAIWEDRRSNHSSPEEREEFAKLAEVSREIGTDPKKIEAHFGGDKDKIEKYRADLHRYEAYRKSVNYLTAVKEAEHDAERIRELIAKGDGIPPEGALALLRNDPQTKARRLFAANCASCHSYFSPADAGTPAAQEQLAKASAPNLYGFGNREWVAGLLDKEKISGPQYFGLTDRFKKSTKEEPLEMVGYVHDEVSKWPKAEVEQVVAALSAQAKLPSQKEADEKDKAMIEAGIKLLIADDRCASCHRINLDAKPDDPSLAENDSGYPDLTHYASREWTIGMICNPAAPRFYGDKNDRMPAFCADAEGSSKNLLSRRDVELIVDWLRGVDPAAK